MKNELRRQNEQGCDLSTEGHRVHGHALPPTPGRHRTRLLAPVRVCCHFAGSGGVGAAPALGFVRYRRQNSKCGRLSPVRPEGQALGLGERPRREESGAEDPWSVCSLGCVAVHAHARASAGEAQEQRPPRRDEHPSTKLLSY